MKSKKILKKVYTKNNNEIVLVGNTVGLESPTYDPNLSTVLIIGVVHGDEPQGKFLIENYLATSVLSSNNKILFIPCLNPDGLSLNTRQNANGVDINRNFAAKNWGVNDSTDSKVHSCHCETKGTAELAEACDPVGAGTSEEGQSPDAAIHERNEFFGGENPASEIETRFVQEIIEEYKPDLILTLHAPFKVVNFDGPAEELAREISKIIDYPVQSDIGYPTPGSFGTYAGIERNIPTITLELDEECDVKTLIEPVNEIFEYLTNIQIKKQSEV